MYSSLLYYIGYISEILDTGVIEEESGCGVSVLKMLLDIILVLEGTVSESSFAPEKIVPLFAYIMLDGKERHPSRSEMMQALAKIIIGSLEEEELSLEDCEELKERISTYLKEVCS